MQILKEFRAFISRGNVIDLAVGVIIGTAFGKIVSSLVSDVIMPPIGYALNGMRFQNLYLAIDGKTYADADQARAAGAIVYGAFFDACIQFIVVAACVFALLKVINSVYKAEKKAASPSKTEVLLEEIRDLLAKK